MRIEQGGLPQQDWRTEIERLDQQHQVQPEQPPTTESDDVRVLADAERGPIFSPDTVARIGAILKVEITRHYETERGTQLTWIMENNQLHLVLVRYKPTAPYTVMGDAEIAFSLKDSSGIPFPVADLRGISRIGIDDSDDPDLVRFEQDDDRHWALLGINRDGSVIAHSHMKRSRRIPQHP